MNKEEVREIINFVNSRYDEGIPGPVKFVVKRKVKKIEKVVISELPESIRKCTVEELLLILKEAYEKKLLKL